MNKDGFREVTCGLDLSSAALKNKKLILVRHPKDLNVAELLKKQKITVPKKGVLSKPLLASSDCTNLINYKLMVDKDPIHNTFRTIIKGGEIGPAFHGSISIVQSVDGSDDNSNSNDTANISTPAITAYDKVPQVRGLRPCLLPLGSIIPQQDFNARVAVIDAATATTTTVSAASSSSSGSRASSSVVKMTPSKDKDKKKKRKSDDIEEPPSTGKQSKKDKKSKKK